MKKHGMNKIKSENIVKIEANIFFCFKVSRSMKKLLKNPQPYKNLKEFG